MFDHTYHQIAHSILIENPLQCYDTIKESNKAFEEDTAFWSEVCQNEYFVEKCIKKLNNTNNSSKQAFYEFVNFYGEFPFKEDIP